MWNIKSPVTCRLLIPFRSLGFSEISVGHLFPVSNRGLPRKAQGQGPLGRGPKRFGSPRPTHRAGSREPWMVKTPSLRANGRATQLAPGQALRYELGAQPVSAWWRTRFHLTYGVNYVGRLRGWESSPAHRTIIIIIYFWNGKWVWVRLPVVPRRRTGPGRRRPSACFLI